MTWTITVKPTTEALDDWGWAAVRGDGETVRFGNGLATHAEALATAQRTVRETERSFQAISDATTVEDYTPSVQVLMRAEA